VVAVDVLEVARLPEAGHPERSERHGIHRAEERERVGVAVEHRHHRCRAIRGEELAEDLCRVLAESGAGAQCAVKQVGARDADDVGLDAERISGRKHLRHHRSHPHERDPWNSLRSPERVSACEHELAPLV
jgi:hypothetical protein